jgi:SAM-dependent methyltransferase
MRNPAKIFRWFIQARRAADYARQLGLPGMQIDRFGRQAGWRLLMRMKRPGLRWLLQPIDFLRYFEFQFAWDHLGENCTQCLDVSSPALFSFFYAHARPAARIILTNPDMRDTELSRKTARCLGIENIESVVVQAADFAREQNRFDAIWSLSVFEHIAGDGDTAAVHKLFRALKPGGKMVLTVMVDRHFHDEYCDEDVYQLGAAKGVSGYFFQRYYDKEAIYARLLSGGLAGYCRELGWYGEKQAGRYHWYVKRAREGYDYSWGVNEPCEAVNQYCSYATWEEMPGVGVAALVLQKPGE